MADDIIIKIRADISDAEAKIKKAGKGLNDLDNAAKDAGSGLDGVRDSAGKAGDKLGGAGKAVTNAATGLGKVPSAANAAASSLDKAAKSSDRAGQALINIGRVAQDAPFGFVGIANNLNPLLESFDRLKAESGSTGGALKALGSSLLGAGGVGLALSLVTAAVTFATSGFGAWTRGLSSNKAEVDKNAKAAKDLAESYKSIGSDIAKELSQVSVLVEQLKSENLTRKEKVEAIKQLQQIAPEYFKGLDQEKASINQITLAYEGYLSQIERVFRARALEKTYIATLERILELQTKGDRLAAVSVKSNGKIQKSQLGIYDANSKTLSTTEALNATLRGTVMLTTAENKELDNLKVTAAILLKQFAGLKGNDGLINIDKTKKAGETIADVLAKLKADIAAIDFDEANFGLDPEAYKNKIKLIQGAIKELITKFKVPQDDKIITKLVGDVGDVKIAEIMRRVTAKVKEQPPVEIPFTFAPAGVNENILGKRPDIPVPQFNSGDVDDAQKIAFLAGVGVTKAFQDGVKVNVSALRGPQLDALYNDFKAKLATLESSLNSVITNTFADAFTGIAEGIGKALAGQGDSIGNIFEGFLKTIAAGLKAIGSALIQYGIAKTIISKLKISGPAAIALGVGLQVFAAALTAKLDLPKFATGGLVGGTGNRDTVQALLTPGEFVMTRAAVGRIGVDNLAALNGGSSPTAAIGQNVEAGEMMINGVFTSMVRGTDIVLVSDRARAKLGRTG